MIKGRFYWNIERNGYLIIKCGRREFKLNENDEILSNGTCYQIITQEYSSGFNKYTPKIAKARAEKMIRDGDLIFKEMRKSNYSNSEMKIYKINK